MTEEFTIHELSLSFSHDRQMLAEFLERHHLSFEADIEAAYGIFDPSEVLVGCGCCAGKLLKCFAVDQALRGQNALGSLISRLVENRFQSGFYDLFVITRPENRDLFTACGFYVLAETGTVIMLENRKDGLLRYYSRFAADTDTADKNPADSGPADLDTGCIVMNCNPFTKGHLALITHAASRCRTLHIFVVEEDRSAFPFDVRLRLVREGTAGMPNVHVHPSGPYMISSATFPTYFLKKGEDAAGIQSELDITLFASRIAPIFSITARFAGEEPLDPVTARYNQAMEDILPGYGIRFIRIPRVTSCSGGKETVISASLVRHLLEKEGLTGQVLDLVPPCTAEYLKQTYGGAK